MRFGDFEVQSFLFGTFRLDGGAMFGPVPKNIWSKRIQADEENCIPMAARSLLIKRAGRTILVDTGCGDKWEEKRRRIFAIQNVPAADLPFTPSEITDVILTHLHFDHAGGVTRWKQGSTSEPELCYPQAEIHLQRENFENGKSPSIREQASYLPENVLPLQTAKLNLLDGSAEIAPNLWVHRIDGHTSGLQWVELRCDSKSILFPSDLFPTSHHLPIPFTMGYDICASTGMKERKGFLDYARERDAIVIFQHDPGLAAAKLNIPRQGHASAGEPITI